MTGLSKEVIAILEKEERQRLLSELQLKMEEDGIIPKASLPLAIRFRYFFECIGGMCIGCLIGAFSLMINFVVFVWMLHLQF